MLNSIKKFVQDPAIRSIWPTVEKTVQKNAEEVFRDGGGADVWLSGEALFDLLEAEQLVVREIELLNFCSRWMNQRKFKDGDETQSLVLQNFKNSIRLCDIDESDLEASCRPIKDLWQRLQAVQSTIALRRRPGIRFMKFNNFQNFDNYQTIGDLYSLSMTVRSTEDVRIRAVFTSVDFSKQPHRSFSILSDHQVLDLSVETFNSDGRLCFRLKDEFLLKANNDYQFQILPQSQAAHSGVWSDDRAGNFETVGCFSIASLTFSAYFNHTIQKLEYV